MTGLFKNRTGFTLMEMLVATLIVGILAAMAISYYGKVIERMRVSEVVTLIGTELSAQERKFLSAHRYVKEWHKLDVQPASMHVPSEENSFSNGLENTIFYTRGKDAEGNIRNGFAVYFEEINNNWFMTADRVGSNDYHYTLTRPFTDKRTYCLPQEGNQRSEVLCADFMGVDNASLLPADPRE